MLKIINCCLEMSSRSLIMGVTQNSHILTESSIFTRACATPEIVMACPLAVYTLELFNGFRRMPVCCAMFNATRQIPLPVSGHECTILHVSAVFVFDFVGAIFISKLSVLANAAWTLLHAVETSPVGTARTAAIWSSVTS